MQTPKRIAVTGSGLVGSLLAMYLVQRGHKVDVYDRRPDIRTVEFSGRSINLAMSNRGWQALKNVGIDEEIRKIAIAMDKRAIHVGEEPTYFQHYGKEGEAIYSISRSLLNRKLVDLAEASGVNFVFNTRIWDIDLDNAILYTGDSEQDARTPLQYDLVFGADGAFSRVRQRMQRSSLFNYCQEFLPVAYKELTITAATNGTHKLEKHALHIWPRGKYMLIALPNTDGSYTCTLFMPLEGSPSFASVIGDEGIEDFFETNFPDIKSEFPDLIANYKKNPVSYLLTVKCYPWAYKDKVALIGDAAHAIVPFYGQGMNAGFEDIAVLNDLMNVHGDDWKVIFSRYQELRKPNADAIAELSYRNFREMSDKTADPSFLLRKKIENWFSEKHPDKWVPLYSRVTFSLSPYAEALAEGDRQARIMDEVMQFPDIENRWQEEEIERFILHRLNGQA